MRKYILILLKYEILVVGGFVAGTFVSQHVLPWAVGCMVVLGLLRWIAFGRFRVRTPADGGIFIVVFMLLITSLATSNFRITIPQVLRVAVGIGIYDAIVNWSVTPSRLRWVVRGIGVAGLGLALFAMISVQWNTLKLTFLPRIIYSSFQVLVSDPVNPNVMAGSLVLLFSIIAGIIVFYGIGLSNYDKILLGVSATIMALVAILTQSRGGILAMGVVLFVLALMFGNRARIILGSLAILAVVLVMLIDPMPFLTTILANTTLGGIQGRLEVWSRAVYMIEDFPFTGVGMGQYQYATELFYPLLYSTAEPAPHAHNLFLQIAVDLGIPGLVAWLAILFTIVYTNWQLYSLGSYRNDGWIKGLGGGLFVSQVALVIHGLLDSVTWGMVKPAPIIWAVWGISVASWLLYRNNK